MNVGPPVGVFFCAVLLSGCAWLWGPRTHSDPINDPIVEEFVVAIAMKRATVAVELCTDAGLHARWEALTTRLAENVARGVSDVRLTGDPVAAEIREVEDAMAESVLVFTLSALPRQVWSELKAAHPAREGVEEDEELSVNVESFVDAAMEKSVLKVEQKSTGEPVEFVEGDWAALSAELTTGQWNTFAARLFQLNNSNVSVPFNKAASRTILGSDES